MTTYPRIAVFDQFSHSDTLVMLLIGGGEGYVLQSDYCMRPVTNGGLEKHMYEEGFVSINRIRYRER
jgi:hypothetical protein